MTDEYFTSKYGWQWIMPSGFSVVERHETSSMFGVAAVETFKHEQFSDARLSWAVLAGPPVDYITDARFKSLVADRDPVNLSRLVDILPGIMPPAGELVEAHALRLADHSPAVEMTQIRPGKQSAEPIHLYVLLCSLEPAAIDRGPDFDYHSVRQYCDPITNQIIVLSPVPLGERVNPETKEIQRIFQVGHDRYQRIAFSAPQAKFQALIGSVKRAARGFHYKMKVRSLRNSWQDASQLLHEEMNASFEQLKNPPPGLRDADIGVFATSKRTD